jgi:hypothetical protein
MKYSRARQGSEQRWCIEPQREDNVGSNPTHATMSKEKLISQAIEDAIAKGVIIHPGAAFDWTNSPDGLLPSRCNAIGALELHLVRTKQIPYQGFIKKNCDYLNVGTAWLYRFHIGFDQGRALSIKSKKLDGCGFEKWEPCKVSQLGMKLRKKYYERSRKVSRAQ